MTGPAKGDADVLILSAGLSPVWQQLLLFDTVTPGTVNRAREVHWCASGKVLNAARALHHLGGPAKALTIVGGVTGGQIVRDFADLGITARWVETATPTRVCTTILETVPGTVTELVPNAAGLGDAELYAFLAACAEEAARATAVVLIGSLPAGTPADFYRDLLVRTPGKVVLDARGPELLEALPAGPFLVKPNRGELAATLGRDLRSETELCKALREMIERGAEWVVVTDGANPAYAAADDRLYRLTAPASRVLNPIGCGDCMAAGIAWAVARGEEPLNAIVFGLAVAADKAGRLLPGEVDRERVVTLAGSVEVVTL
jgi:tagatose 6-phosphate kinase